MAPGASRLRTLFVFLHERRKKIHALFFSVRVETLLSSCCLFCDVSVIHLFNSSHCRCLFTNTNKRQDFGKEKKEMPLQVGFIIYGTRVTADHVLRIGNESSEHFVSFEH